MWEICQQVVLVLFVQRLEQLVVNFLQGCPDNWLSRRQVLLIQTCCNKIVTKLTTQGLNNIVIS